MAKVEGKAGDGHGIGNTVPGHRITPVAVPREVLVGEVKKGQVWWQWSCECGESARPDTFASDEEMALDRGMRHALWAATSEELAQAKAAATTPARAAESKADGRAEVGAAPRTRKRAAQLYGARKATVTVSGRGELTGYEFPIAAGVGVMSLGTPVRKALSTAAAELGAAFNVVAKRGTKVVGVVPKEGHRAADWAPVLRVVAETLKGLGATA